MSDIQAEEVKWLWYPYLPRGKAGYPGNGVAAAFETPVSDGADTGAGEGVYRSVEQDFGGCEDGAPELWKTGWESERRSIIPKAKESSRPEAGRPQRL